MAQTTGLINARNAKPPRPPASSKAFAWPAKQGFTPALYQRFAASLQELLPRRNQTHVDLGKALFGESAIGAPRSLRGRNWILAKGRAPDANEAAYVAQFLEVPMERLLAPEGKFDPRPSIYKPRGKGKGRRKQRAAAAAEGDPPPAKKRRYTKTKHTNGHDDDPRWILPMGVQPPHVKLETSAEHPSLVMFELKAELPLYVATAITQMVDQRKTEEREQIEPSS